jgi:hypothetical protein
MGSVHNKVRAFHFGIDHPFRITAAATRGAIIAGEFGLDIAAQRHVLQHSVVDCEKVIDIDIEPIEIAVEDQPDIAALVPAACQDRFQCSTVSVKATDHVQRLGAPCTGLRKIGRRVPIGEGTTASRPHHVLARVVNR